MLVESHIRDPSGFKKKRNVRIPGDKLQFQKKAAAAGKARKKAKAKARQGKERGERRL